MFVSPQPHKHFTVHTASSGVHGVCKSNKYLFISFTPEQVVHIMQMFVFFMRYAHQGRRNDGSTDYFQLSTTHRSTSSKH